MFADEPTVAASTASGLTAPAMDASATDVGSLADSADSNPTNGVTETADGVAATASSDPAGDSEEKAGTATNGTSSALKGAASVTNGVVKAAIGKLKAATAAATTAVAPSKAPTKLGTTTTKPSGVTANAAKTTGTAAKTATGASTTATSKTANAPRVSTFTGATRTSTTAKPVVAGTASTSKATSASRPSVAAARDPNGTTNPRTAVTTATTGVNRPPSASGVKAPVPGVSKPAVKASTTVKSSTALTAPVAKKAPGPVATTTTAKARPSMAGTDLSKGSTSTTAAARRTSTLPAGAASVMRKVSSTTADAPSAALVEAETKVAQSQAEVTQLKERIQDLETSITTIEEQTANLKASHLAEITQLKEDLDAAISSSKASVLETDSLVALLRGQVSEGESKLTESKLRHDTFEKELATLQSTQASTLSDLTASQALARDLQDQLASTINEHENAVESLKLQHADEREKEGAEAKALLETNQKEFKSFIENSRLGMQRTSEEAKSEFDVRLANELSKATMEAATAHATEIESIKARHGEQLNNLQSEHDVEVNSLKNAHESAILQVGKDNDAAVQALKATHLTEKEAGDQSIESLRAEHVETLKTLRGELENQYKDAHASLKSDHEVQLNEAQEQSKKNVAEAEAAAAASQTMSESVIFDLRHQLQNVESKFEQEAITLKQAHAAEVDEAFKKGQDEAGGSHSADLKALKEQSQNSINEMLKAHEAEVESIKAASALQADSSNAETTNELNKVKLELAVTTSDLNKSRSLNAELEEKLLKAIEEGHTVKQSLKDAEAKASITPDESEQLQSLRQDLTSAKTQLEESQSTMQTLKSSFADELRESHELHAKEVERHISAKVEAEDQVKKLTSQFETEIRRAKEGHAQIVEELAEQIEEEVKRAKVNEQSRKQLQQQLDELEPKLAQQQQPASLQHVLDKNIQSLHEAHNLKVNELERKIEELESTQEDVEFEKLQLKETVKELESKLAQT